MRFFTLLTKARPRPPRQRMSGVAVAALLRGALSRRGDYLHMSQKQTLAVITTAELIQVADAVFMPWKQDAWECEDQARAVIDRAQRLAANEGCSWAVGTLRAQPPPSRPQDTRHVYVWAVVCDEPGKAAKLILYDQTARRLIDRQHVREVDYTLT